LVLPADPQILFELSLAGVEIMYFGRTNRLGGSGGAWREEGTFIYSGRGWLRSADLWIIATETRPLLNRRWLNLGNPHTEMGTKCFLKSGFGFRSGGDITWR
jgi:hypothetical protein